MENEVLQKLVQEHPKVRCLLCTNLQYTTIGTIMGHVPKKYRCSIGLTAPCGRNFNPRGGNMVPA